MRIWLDPDRLAKLELTSSDVLGAVREQNLQIAAGLVGAAPAPNAPAPNSVIQAYPPTNSIIISASEPMYRSLRTVIDALDQRRAQVYVEALIVEVNANKAAEFGVQWNAGRNIGNGQTLFGGTNVSFAFGLALDATSAPVVVGETNAANFPATPGAFQPTFNEPTHGLPSPRRRMPCRARTWAPRTRSWLACGSTAPAPATSSTARSSAASTSTKGPGSLSILAIPS